MNARIEVPLTLPPPHFDDDETIATARQVVPIKGAKRFHRQRRMLTLLPLLLASTLCGALGAVVINYYDRRRDVPAAATQPPALPSTSTQAQTAPSPDVTPESTAKVQEIDTTVQPKNPEDASADQAPATEKSENNGDQNERPKLAPAAARRESTPDPAKLVRKRRVQRPDAEIPKRKGAGGIEELFSGPNP